jgi:protein O-mannosyl-transferase
MFIGAAAILAMVFIAYASAIRGGFIWDDDWYVSQNRLLIDLDGLWRIWFSPRDSPQYYPMVFTSFWIEHHIWGLHPAGYHIVNILLHACSALLVWQLCKVLGIRGAWFIAAVFAVHPVHVESVAWITERKNVLSAMFYLAAALCYLRFDALAFRDASAERRRQSMGWYGACILLFVAALLSKSVTCSLPAALILMLLWLRERITVRRLLSLAPMFVLGFVAAMHTAYVERTHVGAIGPDFSFSIADRLVIASKALLFYPWKLLWPTELMFNYPRWVIDDAAWFSYVPVVIVIAITSVAAVLYIRGWRGPSLALAFYAGTIFPALGFVNIYPMQFSFVADHFQYLASLGVIALVVGSIASFDHHKSIAVSLGAIILLGLIALTARQASTYESAETVYRDTLAKNPHAWMPQNNLGLLLLERDPQQAEIHFRESLRLKPDHYKAGFNLVTALRDQGRIEEAATQLQRVIDNVTADSLQNKNREPEFLSKEYRRLAQLHVELGHAAEAEKSFLSALRLSPGDPTTHAQLAQLYLDHSRIDEAVSHFRASLKHGGDDWYVLRALGIIYYNKAEYANAIAHMEGALGAAQSWNEHIQIAPELIRMLTTSPDPAQRNVQRAIALAEQLCELTNQSEPAALDILASVYAEADRFQDAVRTGERAIALAKSQGLMHLVEGMTQRVGRYRQGKRARE